MYTLPFRISPHGVFDHFLETGAIDHPGLDQCNWAQSYLLSAQQAIQVSSAGRVKSPSQLAARTRASTMAQPMCPLSGALDTVGRRCRWPVAVQTAGRRRRWE